MLRHGAYFFCLKRPSTGVKSHATIRGDGQYSRRIVS